MTAVRKIGIVLTLIGICLPTVTLPFIQEFHPLPDICLTSNFFSNLGNMIVTFGSDQAVISSGQVGTYQEAGSGIPYRYLFSSGVLLTLIGIGMITLSVGTNKKS